MGTCSKESPEFHLMASSGAVPDTQVADDAVTTPHGGQVHAIPTPSAHSRGARRAACSVRKAAGGEYKGGRPI